MPNFTLRQLRYFEALAAHGHFGRAADACAITQPALSLQIKELEHSVGVALFERKSRNVQLTGFGEEFAIRAREILRSVDELDELARASREGLKGTLRIGVIPTIAPYLLPTIIHNLNQMNAGIDIQIRETQTKKLIEELTEGRIDTAIVALPVSEPSFNEIALFEENFVLVRPLKDENQPVPEADTLRDMRLLLLEEGHCFRDQALSYCSINPGGSWSGLEGSSLSTLVQMVGAGIGVTMLPEMAVPVETSSASVSVVDFKSPSPSRTVGMIWRKTSPLADRLEQVSEIVRESAETLRSFRGG